MNLKFTKKVSSVMDAKYKLSITTFDMVGGRHFYGSVYRHGIKVKELDRPDDNPEYRAQGWTTIKFATALDVVRAAEKWFLVAPEVKPGEKLIVWSGYFEKKELAELKKSLTKY